MADMKNTGFGLLSEFGLDLPDEGSVRTLLRQKRISDAMKFVSPQPGQPEQGGFGGLGAALGNALGEKYRQPQTGYGNIPPEIQSRLDTVKYTKDEYGKWEAANKEATQEQRADKYQEILAQSAFKAGAEDIGINVLRELQDRRIAVKTKQEQLKKIGLENQYDEETLRARVAKTLYDSNKEGVVQFYPRGETSPNGGLTGRLNADGTVTTIGQDGQPKTFGLGEYQFDRPQWHPSIYNRGGGGDSGIGKPEKAKLRQAMSSTMNLNDGYLAVLDLIRETGEARDNPMGQVGKLTSLANRSIGHIEQLATLASPTGTLPTFSYVGGKKNYDINSAAGRAEWARDNAAWARQALPGLRQKGENADRYIAMITELAYAKAMAMEGGSSRSLSDNDFKNSFISIGGNINDPKAMAKILLADADRLHSRLENSLYMYGPEEVESVIAERGFERYGAQRQRLDAYRDGSAFSAPAAQAAPKSPAPKGVNQADWDYMTPEERALFK